MRLSVIILNYNVRYFLELCIKSVEAAITNIDAEIIVVDNNSKDESCTMVKRQFPSVKLIENKKNSGFSKGNNIGVAQAVGDYLCILNPDTVVAEDTFEKLLEFAESKEKAGIIGCQLIDGTGLFLPESKRNIPIPKVAIQKMMGYGKNYYTNTLKKDEIGKSDILVGAFMIIKRKVYNEVKGFDEDYFMYGEDIDLSYKVLKAGYTNYYYGKTTVIHYKGESTLKDKIYAKRFFDSMELFYKKHLNNNFLLSNIIKIGTYLGPLLNKSQKEIQQVEAKKYYAVTTKSNPNLKQLLKKQITNIALIEEYQDDSEYILDNNTLSFKSIIEVLSKRPKASNSTFKILPKNSNFILGSNSSKVRGEINLF